MATPDSLIMVAPLTSSTALEIGVGPATFARSSLATFIQSGLVKTAAIDEARFEAEGYLTEGARTNIALFSEDFANAYWQKTNISNVVDTTYTTPEGIAGTTRQLYTGGLVQHLIFSTASAHSAGATITATTWFLYDGGQAPFIQFRLVGTSTNDRVRIMLDITTGATTEVQSGGDYVFASVDTEVFANGWVRISLTATTTVSVNSRIQVFPSTTFSQTGTTFTADGTSKLYLWGAQIEEGDFASSYIKTVASTVTRAEDQLSYDAANWPTLNTEVSIGVDSAFSIGGTTQQMVVRVAGLSNVDFATNTADQFRGRYNGVVSIDTTTVTGALNRFIYTWATGGNGNLYTDTVLKDTDAAVNTTGTVTEITLGRVSAGSDNTFGHIKNVRIYSTELTQEEINDELIVDVNLNSLINSTIDTPINTFLN